MTFKTSVYRYGILLNETSHSTITVVRGFDLRVGGLNQTELYDLRQIPTPLGLGPWRNDLERFGVWSASFSMSPPHCGFEQILCFLKCLLLYNWIGGIQTHFKYSATSSCQLDVERASCRISSSISLSSKELGLQNYILQWLCWRIDTSVKSFYWGHDANVDIYMDTWEVYLLFTH